jgi:RNA polymerase sigma-70 factor (ECF subfamily)
MVRSERKRAAVVETVKTVDGSGDRWEEPVAGTVGAGADDSTLLAAARSGDDRALDALCRRNWKPVFRSFARFTDSPAEAEDLTQEVFLRALRSLPRFEDRGLPFAAYLLRIADNLARDRWRAGSRRPVVVSELPDGVAPEPGPDHLALDGDRRDALQAALDILSPDHRAVLRLRILEGRSTAEVARLIHRSPPAVRQLQVRALNALRAALGDDDNRFTSDTTHDERDPR